MQPLDLLKLAAIKNLVNHMRIGSEIGDIHNLNLKRIYGSKPIKNLHGIRPSEARSPGSSGQRIFES